MKLHFLFIRTLSENYKVRWHSLRNRTEKLAKDSLFYLFLKLIQYIIYIPRRLYTYIVFILYIILKIRLNSARIEMFSWTLIYLCSSFSGIWIQIVDTRGLRCHYRLVVGFINTYSLSVYHYWSSNPAHGEVYSIQYYVIKFVSDYLCNQCLSPLML